MSVRAYIDDLLFVLGDDRKRLPFIYVAMLFSAGLDLLGIGLIVPLILTLTQGAPANFSKVSSITEFVEPRVLACAVLLIFLSKAVMAYQAQRAITRFTESHRSRLMVRLMREYLTRPYDVVFSRSSSEVINNTLYTTYQYSSGTLAASLRLMADATSFVAILVFLAMSNWQAVMLLSAFLGAVLAYYDGTVKNKIRRAGKAVVQGSSNVINIVNHSLGAIREVRVLGLESFFVDRLQTESLDLADAHASYAAMSAVPRHVIEFSVMLLLVMMSMLVLSNRIETGALMPLLGLFGVAALRLIPGAVSIMTSVGSLRMNRYALTQIASDLRAVASGGTSRSTALGPARRGNAPLQSVSFSHVSYTYPSSSLPAVTDLTFSVRAGQAVGLIGRSGSGKSTTADLLLGLLSPQGGEVLADGKDIRFDMRGWMDRLAYIPQAIFVMDDSLRRNVAFGVADQRVDSQRLEYAISAARLDDVVGRLPQGLDTNVGERGVRLSGGERQRVALARAIYHDRDFIVMDEATAALDMDTEREVVRTIRELHGQKTLFIIAHRLSTLEGCDLILRMDAGRIVESGSYEQVVRKQLHGAGPVIETK